MFSSGPEREFIGWTRPVLPEAVDRLVRRFATDGRLDLGGVIVVLPGQRAGRRLQELLAIAADERDLLLTPPAVITESSLPERLYVPQKPFADSTTQHLAWAQAILEIPASVRAKVFPFPPAADEKLRWLELGKRLARLHTDLAAECLSFEDVRDCVERLKHPREAQRWDALATARQRYLAILDALGVCDRQTARLAAIENREIQTTREIILLGVVDLHLAIRRMLDQVGEKTTIWVAAPAEHAAAFDSYGCVAPNWWRNATLDIPDGNIENVEGPDDQAFALTRWLAQIGPRFCKDEVAIGVADETLVPQLQRHMTQIGQKTRWVGEKHVGDSRPFRLLSMAARFAAERRYTDFAAILRHPDIERWLQQAPSTAVGQLDQFQNDFLPARLAPGFLARRSDSYPELAQAAERIDRWLEPASRPLLLRQWAEVFPQVLAAIYRESTENEVLEALRAMMQALDSLPSLPEPLDVRPLSATDAFYIAFSSLAGAELPPPLDPDALEILGWLELPLDDAAALAVLSLNEGNVAGATPVDSFLPDGLRRELRIEHNDRRYARDAYALSVLIHSRAEWRLFVPRRDGKGDPLQPSRLLFACPDETMIARARKFFQERPPCAPLPALLGASEPLPQSLFVVPQPEPLAKKPTHFRVTRFKDYLASPYRYYLKHVKKLQAVDDSLREMDGLSFGNLLHRVLSAFGHAPPEIRNATSEKTIREFLMERLSDSIRALWDDSSRAVLRLQLKQAELRLALFARQQAERTQEGWCIVYAEPESQNIVTALEAPFLVDDETMTLIGRIDRIDFHRKNRTVCILDYKTSDDGMDPAKVHRSGEEWVDLQLPLYRHLWREAWPDAPDDCAVQLGYFNLPKARSGAGVQLANWDRPTLAAADDTARWVIRQIRSDMFTDSPAPRFEDEFAAICLENVMRSTIAVDGETDS